MKGISATALSAGLAGGMLHWTDLVTAQAAELRNRGMACILLVDARRAQPVRNLQPQAGPRERRRNEGHCHSRARHSNCRDFPELAKQAKDMAIIRSMTSKEGAHPRAQFLMHTGYLPMASVKYPTLGSIVCHELADTSTRAAVVRADRR